MIRSPFSHRAEVERRLINFAGPEKPEPAAIPEETADGVLEDAPEGAGDEEFAADVADAAASELSQAEDLAGNMSQRLRQRTERIEQGLEDNPRTAGGRGAETLDGGRDAEEDTGQQLREMENILGGKHDAFETAFMRLASPERSAVMDIMRTLDTNEKKAEFANLVADIVAKNPPERIGLLCSVVLDAAALADARKPDQQNPDLRAVGEYVSGLSSVQLELLTTVASKIRSVRDVSQEGNVDAERFKQMADKVNETLKEFDLSTATEAQKNLRIGQVMMTHGVSVIEKGGKLVALAPADASELGMNKLVGFFMFLTALGEMFKKKASSSTTETPAAGSNIPAPSGAPSNQPAPTPSSSPAPRPAPAPQPSPSPAPKSAPDTGNVPVEWKVRPDDAKLDLWLRRQEQTLASGSKMEGLGNAKKTSLKNSDAEHIVELPDGTVSVEIEGRKWLIGMIGGNVVMQKENDKEASIMLPDNTPLTHFELTSWSYKALEYRRSELEDAAKMNQNFEIAETGEPMAYIEFADLSDRLTGNISRSNQEFPQMLAKRYNVVMSPDSRIDASQGNDPVGQLRSVVRQNYTKGVRNFYLSVLAHGSKFAMHFGNNDVDSSDITKLFTEFPDCKFTLNAISCFGGGLSREMADFKDHRDAKEGRIAVFTQTKGDVVNYASATDSRYTTLYNAALAKYLLQGIDGRPGEKLAYGQAHMLADREAKKSGFTDAEVNASRPDDFSARTADTADSNAFGGIV